MIGDPHFSIAGAPISTALCYWLIALLNLFHIARLSHGLPPVGRTLVRPLAATAGRARWSSSERRSCALRVRLRAAYSTSSRLLRSSRRRRSFTACCCSRSRAIERADVLLLPHGAKIADILHLK